MDETILTISGGQRIESPPIPPGQPENPDLSALRNLVQEEMADPQEPLPQRQSKAAGMELEGGDLGYTRPAGGETDGWIRLSADPDPDSGFWGKVCHGDPQTTKLDTSKL